MKQKLMIFLVFLSLIFLVACQKPSENKSEEISDHLTGKNAANIEEYHSVNLLQLTEYEKDIYNWFSQSHDDTILSELDPLTVSKLFLHAGTIEEFDTEYAFLVQEEIEILPTVYPVLWSKEEHLKFNQNRADQELDVFRRSDNLAVSYHNNGRNAVISWNNEDVEPLFLFTFRLVKNDEGIWKVEFLPMQ